MIPALSRARGALCLSLFLMPSLALAVPPPSVLNHQGRIVVDGTNYGSPGPETGHFKFALVNNGVTETYWTNNGSSVGLPGGEPNAAVPVTVTNGHYSLGLGDVSFTNMTTAIPASVFENSAGVYLAVWFSTDSGGPYELLAPNRRITSGAYALHATKAEGVVDEAITNAMLAAGSITADKFDVGLSLDDADADPANELQTLELVGTDLSISSGNTVSLGGLVDDGNWGYYEGEVEIVGDTFITGVVTIGAAVAGAATGYELTVDGKIACEEILVDLSQNWPDYVFADDYELRPLSEVEAHIDAKKHLPGIPSAAEVDENGIKLAGMQIRMMEKIEELTLYTIQQQKLLEAQSLELEKLKSFVGSAQ